MADPPSAAPPTGSTPPASPGLQRNSSIRGLTEKTTVVADGSTQWKKERRDAWEWKSPLGVGSYSEVFLVVDKQTGKEYAAKVMSKRELLRLRKVEAAFAEKALLTELKHPGIIGLFQTFQDPESLYFILELCSGGDLLDLLNAQPDSRFSEEMARFLLAQILTTVEFMHSKNVIYRDLKPENILLDSGYHSKICDFNTAVKIKSSSDTVGSFAGTAEYLPPELIIDQKMGLSGDLWSFGCLMYQLLSGMSPFRAASEFLSMQQIRNRDFQWNDAISASARDLIDRLLTLDPSARPSIEQIKKHDFFAGVDWDRVFDTKSPLTPKLPRHIDADDAAAESLETI